MIKIYKRENVSINICRLRPIPWFRRGKKKIDVTAPRGALGVTSMRRLSSTSGVLEEYFSSTSLNIFFPL